MNTRLTIFTATLLLLSSTAYGVKEIRAIGGIQQPKNPQFRSLSSPLKANAAQETQASSINHNQPVLKATGSTKVDSQLILKELNKPKFILTNNVSLKNLNHQPLTIYSPQKTTQACISLQTTTISTQPISLKHQMPVQNDKEITAKALVFLNNEQNDQIVPEQTSPTAFSSD